MRSIRGSEIAMIFQDPMTALNPVFTVGFQIIENLYYHTAMRGRQLKDKAIDLLRAMGIPLPERRVDQFPHQYSGGMRQRAMIAMAMACNPKILIADEPTTALDVTIQAQIFELMTALKKEHGTAIMLITHDMGVVAELADDVAVMYMGNIVEAGTVEDVLRHPTHPYTRALLDSIPVLGRGRNQSVRAIPGATPDPLNRPVGCQFADRCTHRVEACDRMPAETQMTPTHRVMCWRHEELAANGRPMPKSSSACAASRRISRSRPGVFKQTVGHVKAVDDVSFFVYRGEVLGLVGESGCGKTTLGKTILQLVRASDGEISYLHRRPRHGRPHRLTDRELDPLSQAPADRLPGSAFLAQPGLHHLRLARGSAEEIWHQDPRGASRKAHRRPARGGEHAPRIHGSLSARILRAASASASASPARSASGPN